MIIKKCKKSDIAALGAFYDDEVKWMDEHDCNGPLWTYKGYPTQSTVEWTFGEGTQYLCMDGYEILGAFVLNTDPMGAYKKVPWHRDLQEGEYMVVHMLCVAHKYARKGIGRAMTTYCIDLAKGRGFKGIRLDVVPANLSARKLYEHCGFHYVGDFDLERNADIPLFSVYELNFK